MTTVPDGMTIHFYVQHGKPTGNGLGMDIESRLAAKDPPKPVESVSAGGLVRNYRLSFASRLNLAGDLKTYNYDWITVKSPDQFVPLSVLFMDPRCTKGCEIHWAACRSIETCKAPDKGGILLTRPKTDLVHIGKEAHLVDPTTGALEPLTAKTPGRLL